MTTPEGIGRALGAIYRRLLDCHGPQHWWPGDGDEIFIGAVLVQNTAWRNASLAIGNLRRAGCLSAAALVSLDLHQLTRLIRPSGYYNVKARRLKALCQWWLDSGGVAALREMPTSALRSQLLSLHGIGPETADCILLYALERPQFVIDAYTRRLVSRLALAPAGADYETLRELFEHHLEADVQRYNEYHALIVCHGKHICRVRPACDACCLAYDCPRAGVT